MRKIINGRRYNTETATKIADYQSDYFCNDFRFYDEALYRKRTGEFFLCGEGGAMTKYSRSCELNLTCGG